MTNTDTLERVCPSCRRTIHSPDTKICVHCGGFLQDAPYKGKESRIQAKKSPVAYKNSNQFIMKYGKWPYDQKIIKRYDGLNDDVLKEKLAKNKPKNFQRFNIFVLLLFFILIVGLPVGLSGIIMDETIQIEIRSALSIMVTALFIAGLIVPISAFYQTKNRKKRSADAITFILESRSILGICPACGKTAWEFDSGKCAYCNKPLY